MRNAGAALYRVKRGKTSRADDAATDLRTGLRSPERLEFKGEIRRAIRQEEFVLFYQPEVRLREGERIFGFEALLRWRHPRRGLLLPAEFIPVAEQTAGLIVPLGKWVLEKACRQVKEWQERYPGEPPLSVCVNLSAGQVRYPGLLRDVGSALAESGLAQGSLILEMTETTLLEDAQTTVAVLEELRALGARLAIDDFGKGYSSLSYLKRLPMDLLKIDRSFVAGFGQDPRDTTIAQSIVSLAHALGLQVIGEGVENAEQLERLRSMGCDLAQGYHIARPLPAEEVDSLLADRLTS